MHLWKFPGMLYDVYVGTVVCKNGQTFLQVEAFQKCLTQLLRIGVQLLLFLLFAQPGCPRACACVCIYTLLRDWKK